MRIPFLSQLFTTCEDFEAISASQAIISLTPTGKILDANANFLRLMGYRRDEIVGLEHRIFMAEEDLGPGYQQFWNELRAGRAQIRRFRRITATGAEVWIEASYNPVVDRRGRVVRVVKIATDVTAGTATALSNAGKLAAINRSMAVIEFETDGTIVNANQNFLSCVGYRRDEIIGHNHRMFVEPEEACSEEYADFWHSLASGRFQSRVFRRIAKSGREIWIQASYNPILDHDGAVLRVIKFATDVTAQTVRSADLSDQANAISRSHAVIQFDLQGNIIRANDLFQQIMGYRADELAGKHQRIFLSEAEAASLNYTHQWNQLRRGERMAGLFHRIRKTGRSVWLRAEYFPVSNAQGEIYAVMELATMEDDQAETSQEGNGALESALA